MKAIIFALTLIFLDNLSSAKADLLNFENDRNISETRSGITDNSSDKIHRKSFEFGLGGLQLQVRGSYTPEILNDNLDIFLKAGFGFIPARAYYGFDLGSNLELGGKYFFHNNSFFKVLTGFTFPVSYSNTRAFYAGIGIGNDFKINKNWGINLGLDFGSTFEPGLNGLGGVLFLRPELNIKYDF